MLEVQEMKENPLGEILDRLKQIQEQLVKMQENPKLWMSQKPRSALDQEAFEQDKEEPCRI